MRDELRDVQACDPLRSQQLGGVRLGLLERGREHVARLHFLATRALDLQNGRLQHAAEGERLFRLLLPRVNCSTLSWRYRSRSFRS